MDRLLLKMKNSVIPASCLPTCAALSEGPNIDLSGTCRWQSLTVTWDTWANYLLSCPEPGWGKL